MDGKLLFLEEHAHLHSAAVSGHGPSLEDSLCEGLSDAQLRARPSGLNSIVWLLWHMTRFEDVAVNAVLRGVPEVLDCDGWLVRLGLDTRMVGTGSSDEEVGDFSSTVSVTAVRAYRAAVGRETRAWVEGGNLGELSSVPDVRARLEQAPHAFGDRAAWVQTLWESRTGYGLLALPVIGHSYIHIGEARVTGGQLGAGVP